MKRLSCQCLHGLSLKPLKSPRMPFLLHVKSSLLWPELDPSSTCGGCAKDCVPFSAYNVLLCITAIQAMLRLDSPLNQHERSMVVYKHMLATPYASAGPS